MDYFKSKLRPIIKNKVKNLDESNLQEDQRKDFFVDEENNTFTLKNCWLIQALGMLRLFDDIKSGKQLLPGYENCIEEYELLDSESCKFTEITDEDSDDWKIIDQISSKYKDLKSTFEKHKRYVLRNSIAYIEFMSVKYFYDILDAETERLKTDDPKYNVEVYEQNYITNNNVDLVYDMIHAKSMKDVLFSAMPLSPMYVKSKSSERICAIFAKKLRFKGAKLEKIDKVPYVRLFVPSILPQYAIFSDNYRYFFEQELPDLNSICSIERKRLIFHPDFLRRFLSSALDSLKKHELPIEIINGVLNEIKEADAYHKLKIKAE